MRRMIVVTLVVCGIGFMSFGLWFGLGGGPAYAQDEADYIGARDCGQCHRNIRRGHSGTPHDLALQDVRNDKALILGDFGQGEAVRTVQFPGDSAPRAFTADDIVYAVGYGRYAQRYVVDLGDKEYAVLPAEWDNVNKAWQPLLLADTWPDPAYDWMQNCAGCHTTGLEVDRGRWKDDGVQCEACHGPGSLHADTADEAGSRPSSAELAQIRAAIVYSPDPQICGQCHSRGTEPDSSHPYPIKYRPGTDLLEPDVFALAAADDPAAWWATGHARQNNMQFNEWMKSAHASALATMKDSAAAQDGCVQCHSGDYAFIERIRARHEAGDMEGDAPPPVTLDTAEYGLTCVTCHQPHPEEPVEFNLTDAPYNLCAACHQNTDLFPGLHHPVKEMFEGQAVVEGVEGIPSVHFSEADGPRCVNCHMTDVPIGGFGIANHTWKVVLPGAADDMPPDSCSKCHGDLTTADLQSLVQDTQEAVRSRLSIAWARVASVEQPEPGTEAAQLYEQAVRALTFVQNDGSQGVHNYTYTDELLDSASAMLARLSVPGANLQPTEAPAPTATPSAPQLVTISEAAPVPTGLRPITVIIIGIVGLILLVGGVVFLRPTRRQPERQEGQQP